MERVVYFLGAGFSAPLGLPVMSDFLFKAKDMFALRPEGLDHFRKIFETIKRISNLKNYINSDLFNIEEILSILEMEDYLDKRQNAGQFSSFIKDVIEHYTPKMDFRPLGNQNDWQDYLFGRDLKWNQYGAFTANCVNLRVARFSQLEYDYTCNSPVGMDYSIITLNYDMILEKTIEYVDKLRENDPIINSPKYQDLKIAKLHGSVHNGTIVAPTWNKTSSKLIEKAWQDAHAWLQDANYLRIIGYSLPISDSHVRYLLKSSILKAERLKYIDVICLDQNGDVRDRYDKFIAFDNGRYRFRNLKAEGYLDNILNMRKVRKIEPSTYAESAEIRFNFLENAHSIFMGAKT